MTSAPGRARVRGAAGPACHHRPMLAARYPTTGPQAGVLEIAEIDRPTPGPGEVLVRVAVSGVNPTDVKTRQRLDGTAPWPDITPNQDGAGIVEAVGDGVPESRVGQRVWLYHAQWQRQRGTAAQLIALPAVQAVALPDGVDLALGACLGIPYITAFHALHADGPIAGAPVLIHGGAGSVGHAAIELAKAAGAKRALVLPVSAPFHSSLLKPAADQLAQALSDIQISEPQIPVVNNVDVANVSDPAAIKDALVRQAWHPVRWVETIQFMKSQGVTHVVECGPGKVLSGLVKRIDRDLVGLSISDPASLQSTLETLKG